MNNKKNNRVFTEATALLWICVLAGVAFLALYSLINILVAEPPFWVGIVLTLADLVCALTVYLVYKKFNEREANFSSRTIELDDAMKSMMKSVDIPCVLTLKNGVILWANAGTYRMLGSEGGLLQKNFYDYSRIRIDDIITSLSENGELGDGSTPVEIGGRRYMARVYPHLIGENSFYLTTFADCTELAEITKKADDDYSVVAYIVLDNLEEIAQYVRVNYRSAANEIEQILKDWAAKLNGFIREYDRDKYIMLFSKENYAQCLENKFDILETVRNVRLGDSSVPVTVSIGISLLGETLAEREKNAAAALELALQRGGDQVAVRTPEEILFFGGRTKGIQKKSGSFARVFATQLTSEIAKSGNVLIMGHSSPDFDSIGACVGMARLCMFCGLAPKIIMDKNNVNFRNCSEKLLALDEYKHSFISAEAGLDMIRSDTLLIIVDANNFNILEAPDVARNTDRFVIIDHHRKTAEYEREPILAHVDPSASSASEMVTEILEQCLAGESLLKEEANVLLAGIMVDTKNFTRTTGTKTFSAAMYLRGTGANSEVAGVFFQEDIDDFLSEAEFGKSVAIYRDRIAITTSDGSDSSFDRVAAARAADKLLGVRGVDAAFALVQIDDGVHISARSNGSINVQLILEKLKGGGHFDSAGAAVKESDMTKALLTLKNAIDEYFKEN